MICLQLKKMKPGNIQMINANIFVIDEITSDIALYIQNALEKSDKSEISIPFGSITGIKLLAGMGPNIKIKVSSSGKVNTDVRSEFIAKGINQTIHRVYLQIDCIVNILTPFETIEKQIGNQVLLIENVIIGNVPSTYYNLEGINENQDLLEVIE